MINSKMINIKMHLSQNHMSCPVKGICGTMILYEKVLDIKSSTKHAYPTKGQE